MQKKVKLALQPTNIPSYFINRKNTLEFPSIVYTIVENSDGNSGDEEELTGYEIFINLYSKGNFIQDKENIKRAMERNEFFYKVSIPSAFYDEELDCYVQPFQYRSFTDNL